MTTTAIATADGPEDGDDWLSTRAAAAMLGVTPHTLFRFIDDGELESQRFGRVIRVRRSDLLDFIERNRIDPTSGT